MKLNKQLIEQVAKGDVAIDNTGNPNLELLRAVLKEAFSRDYSITNGNSQFYRKMKGFKQWYGTNDTYLSTIPLLDFLEKEEYFSKIYTLQKLTNNNMENKEIEYYEVLKQCWGLNGITWSKGQLLYVTNKDSLLYFKEIGLLDNLNYFKPVYKETKKLPKINNFDGKVEGDFVIYGNNCAKFHKQFFKNLSAVNVGNNWGNRKVNSIKLDSGVEITMDEVKQIVDFLN